MTEKEFYRLPVGTKIVAEFTGWEFTVTNSDGNRLSAVRRDGQVFDNMVYSRYYKVVNAKTE